MIKKFTEAQFNAMLNLFMSADPCPIEDNERLEIENLLNSEAIQRGSKDWIESLHAQKDVGIENE